MASSVIRAVGIEHILPRTMHLAGSQGDLYQVRPLTAVDCCHFQGELQQWTQLGESHSAIVSGDLENLLASEPCTAAISLCLYYDTSPVAVVVSTFRPANDDFPTEGIYMRVLVKSGLAVTDVGADLLTFARDLYFARIPWLLSVLIEARYRRNSNPQTQFECHGFRFCGLAGPPDGRVFLFETERPRWLRQRRREISSQPTDPSFLAEFSALVGKSIGSAPVVFFRTGSYEKRTQYQYLFRCFGIDIQDVKHSVSLIEPQVEGHGPESESALVHEPLKLFSRFAAREESYPFVVEDTMLFIEHFNVDFERRPMLPGPDTKRWWAGLGVDGILRAMSGSRLRQALYVCQLGVHIRPGEYAHFRAELKGSIADSKRISPMAEQLFPYSNATFFHSLFVPCGASKTLAEMGPAEFRLYDYRRQCLASAAGSLGSYGRKAEGVQLEIPFELD